MSTEKKKIGRPPKTIDFKLFQSLCEIQCTEIEICSVLDVTDKTLTRILMEEYGESFSETYKKFSAPGKISLRRWQYKLAEKGNATMLIWLGKQVLDQKDTQYLPTRKEDWIGEQLQIIVNDEEAKQEAEKFLQ